ncbi:MAG TPA: aldehyde dehydrogenase family protein, partial [Beutenbergiaceae bacterium]|nr:aldehyde dehydrogenase family protein [Beutenbergiaceae bacterium]
AAERHRAKTLATSSVTSKVNPGRQYQAAATRVLTSGQSSFDSVKPGMPLFDKETFGPVAAIACVPSFDEALAAAANDSYGLGATVLTNSLDHASQAAPELPWQR